MEPLSSFSADGILDDDLRHESVEGRGHRRELGVVAALALHRVQLQVQLVSCVRHPYLKGKSTDVERIL